MKRGRASHGEAYSTIAEQPGTHWACDTKQMYEDIYGYRNLLVVVDMCSRQVYLRALKTVGGEETVKVLRELIQDWGIPTLISIRHDAGTQFVDSRVQKLLADFNISSVCTVAGNKQQNGLAERTIQTARIQLAAIQWDSGNNDWSEALKDTEVVLNNASRLVGGVNSANRGEKVVIPAEDEEWIDGEGGWILAVRDDKKKLDSLPRVWDGPFKVVSKNKQLVDIQDVAGNRSLVPISNTKVYQSEVNEDIEETELIMYNATNNGEPFYIVSRVIDHLPKHGITKGNLKLRVKYLGYQEENWYEAKHNRDILKTEAFAKYIESHKDVAVISYT